MKQPANKGLMSSRPTPFMNDNYYSKLIDLGLAETIVTVPSPGEDISVGLDSQPPVNDLDPEYHFENYRSHPDFQYAQPPIDPHPWPPFSSHHNFELAEFILDAALTEKQMKTMFQLLKPEAGSNQDNMEFNIRSPKEFKEHWDLAVNMITPFEKSMITTWALDLIQDPTLELYFVWDAVQLSKWNGQAFERFIDEPWTAQAFWDLQTKLPKGGKVLYYIIYADKTCLSSFGTAQGYPVIARLGNLKNAFWNVEDCDPFRALSFDSLHAHDNGLFGDHLRSEVVSRIEALGSKSVGWADDQIKCFPCWRNLYHFESGFMAVHFADSTKYEDLSKHIIFVTQNILTEIKDVHGYHLLKCVRSYMELHMYAGFNLHTERSMQAIRDELVKFSELIREYEQLTKSVKPGAKSWNFPKIHSHKHMVDDILAKGVTLNYNTKPNEKMHGPLKDAYQM
ncbi:hypothetical protein IW262DRAFT_1462797 [Armillaria fumosa]|nr:hypothetical protein IW262DRAFT_1462797 [Armillaria fumosa]